jgi:hypothetical protein
MTDEDRNCDRYLKFNRNEFFEDKEKVKRV